MRCCFIEGKGRKKAGKEKLIDIVNDDLYKINGEGSFIENVAEKPFHDTDGLALSSDARLFIEHNRALLSEEIAVLTDFYITVVKEHKEFLKIKKENKIDEAKWIRSIVRLLDGSIKQAKRRQGGESGDIKNPFSGFHEKVQLKGLASNLNIACERNYVACDDDIGEDTISKDELVIKQNLDLQLIPLGWKQHATFMVIDHNNRKVIFFDPNMAYQNRLSKFLNGKELNKKNVLEVFVGKSNADLLQNYDLIDANSQFSYPKGSDIGIGSAWRHHDFNVSYLPGNGHCAFVSRDFAEIFVKNYCRTVSENMKYGAKEKQAKNVDYRWFVSDVINDMDRNFHGLSIAVYQRIMLRDAFERFLPLPMFYNIAREKEGLKRDSNVRSTIAKYFPQTLAKFEHILSYYKDIDDSKEMKVFTWQDAVKQTEENKRIEEREKRQKMQAKANVAVRKIMKRGFEETFGKNMDMYCYDGTDGTICESSKYLQNMVKHPTSYKDASESKKQVIDVYKTAMMYDGQDTADAKLLKDNKAKWQEKYKFVSGEMRWDSPEGREYWKYRDIKKGHKIVIMGERRKGQLNSSPLGLESAKCKNKLNNSTL